MELSPERIDGLQSIHGGTREPVLEILVRGVVAEAPALDGFLQHHDPRVSGASPLAGLA